MSPSRDEHFPHAINTTHLRRTLFLSVRFDRLRWLYIIKFPEIVHYPYILRALRRGVPSHGEEIERETDVKIIARLDLGDVFRSKLQAQRGDVGLEVNDLTAADQRDDIWTLR